MVTEKKFDRKFRIEWNDDGNPVFETRYYAQRFIDEFISQWCPPHDFLVEKREDGYHVFCKVEITLDKYNEPMIRYKYN